MTIDIWMTVIPVDEICCTKGIFGVNAGDIQSRVFNGAGCKHDDIVVSAQLVEVDICAVVDIADEPNVTAIHDPMEGFDNALDPRVIRCHTVSNQTKRGWIAVKEVNGYLEIDISFLE